jgi:hypothetical protein
MDAEAALVDGPDDADVGMAACAAAAQDQG